MASFTIPITITTKGAVASLKGLENAARSTATALSNIGKSTGINNAARGLVNMASRLTDIFGLLVRIEAARFLQQLPGQIYDLNRQFTSFENTLLTTYGSAERVSEEMSFLQGVSQQLGTDVIALTGGYTKFAAAAEATTLSVAESRDIFQSFSQAATVLQLDAQSTELTFRALTQMLSKGKVQAEELRGQLAEHLPGAFQVAAKAMGVTTSQLDQMLRKGEILATDLLPKMAKAIKETYALGLISASRTWAAEVGRLRNAFIELGAGIGDAIQQPMRDFTRWLREVVQKWTPDIIAAFKDIGNAGYVVSGEIDRLSGRFSNFVQEAYGSLIGETPRVEAALMDVKKALKEGLDLRGAGVLDTLAFGIGRIANMFMSLASHIDDIWKLAVESTKIGFESAITLIKLGMEKFGVWLREWVTKMEDSLQDLSIWSAYTFDVAGAMARYGPDEAEFKASVEASRQLRDEAFKNSEAYQKAQETINGLNQALIDQKAALDAAKQSVRDSMQAQYELNNAQQNSVYNTVQANRAWDGYVQVLETASLALEQNRISEEQGILITKKVEDGVLKLKSGQMEYSDFVANILTPTLAKLQGLFKKLPNDIKETEEESKEATKAIEKLNKAFNKLLEKTEEDIVGIGEEMAVLAIKTRDVGKETAETEKDIAKIRLAYEYYNKVLEVNGMILEANRLLEEKIIKPERHAELMAKAKAVQEANDRWLELSTTLIETEYNFNKLEEANDKATEAAKESAKVFEDIATNIHSAFSDAFLSVFTGAENAFRDFAGRMKDLFMRLLADLAALALSRTIVIPIIATVAGETVAAAVSKELGAGVLGGGGGGVAGQVGTSLLSTAGTKLMGVAGAGLTGLGGALGGGFGGGLALTGNALMGGSMFGGIQSGLAIAQAGGGMLPLIGAAMPYIGAALLIGYGLYKAFGKSKKDVTPDLSIGAAVGGQIGDIYAGEGDVFGQVESAFGRFGVVTQHDAFTDSEAANQFMQMLKDLATFEDRLADFLSDDVVQAIRDALEEGAQRFKAEDPEDFDKLIQEFLKDRFDTIFSVIGGTVEKFYQMVSASAPDTLTAVESVYNLYTAIGGLSQVGVDASRAIELLSKTQWEAGGDLYNSIMDQIEAYDGSYESTVALTGSLEQFRQAALQMLVVIDQVQKAVTQMISQTRENIVLSGMTAEEQFNYYRKQANELAKELATTTDPTRIAELIQEITRLTELSWGLLTPEQQAAQRQDYINYLDGIEKLANERLELARQETVNAAKAMADAVVSAIELAAQAFIPPANTMNQAANIMLNASVQPVRVQVDIPDWARDVIW